MADEFLLTFDLHVKRKNALENQSVCESGVGRGVSSTNYDYHDETYRNRSSIGNTRV